MPGHARAVPYLIDMHRQDMPTVGGMPTIPDMDPDAVVDPESRLPVYVQVAGILAARIRAGHYQYDRPIPSETQIQQEWGVARATARKGIRLLADAGYVETVTGRGSYVVWRNEE